MLNNKWIVSVVIATALCSLLACKKQLDVGNPNSPTLDANVTNETGIIQLATGSVYTNGFTNGDVWLGDSYFSLPYSYSELMGDVVGADASNQLISTINIPNYYILDNGTKVNTPSANISLLRTNNTRAQTGSGYNPFYYQWLNMYALNNACNIVLSRAGSVAYTGDTATKANTIRAWCYWWKGYAYASIGSMYYSGLIIDAANGTSNRYQVKDSVIARSNAYFTLAAGILKNSIRNQNDYNSVLGRLIPVFCQVGNGGVPTTDMWIRNINTMLARNILVNHLAPFVNGNPAAQIAKASMTPMTTADWNKVLQLASTGIRKGDDVFTGRTTNTNSFFSADGGSVAALTTGNNISSTFKITERFVQNFKTGDKRFSNNFTEDGVYPNDLIFSTRYSIVDGGKGTAGVFTYSSKTTGEYELYIAGSYEENTLMLAEANIRLGQTNEGLSYIDEVRNYMGAGVAAVTGTGLSTAQALTELTKERRVALVFRGLSYYDSRRWGWTYDIANGGGSYGNAVLVSNQLNTNVTINYNFLDYWDVPADESVLNSPGENSAPVKNPNF